MYQENNQKGANFFYMWHNYSGLGIKMNLSFFNHVTVGG